MGITGDACRERRKLRNLDDLIRAPPDTAQEEAEISPPSAILIANLEPEPEKPTFDCSGPGRAGAGSLLPRAIANYGAQCSAGEIEEGGEKTIRVHFPLPVALSPPFSRKSPYTHRTFHTHISDLPRRRVHLRALEVLVFGHAPEFNWDSPTFFCRKITDATFIFSLLTSLAFL